MTREARVFEDKRKPLTPLQQQLFDIIEKQPGIMRTPLAELMGVNRSRLIAIAETLEDHDVIHRRDVQGGTGGYQVAYFPGSVDGS